MLEDDIVEDDPLEEPDLARDRILKRLHRVRRRRQQCPSYSQPTDSHALNYVCLVIAIVYHVTFVCAAPI